MKTLKKVMKRAAIIIGVLLLVFIGFLIYRNAVSYHNVIHQDASAVVKIRVDAIGRAVLWDALKHPDYYYERQKQKDTLDDFDSFGKGFSIPANIFLYTVKGKSMSTVFTSFKISNVEKFKAFLSSDLKIEEAHYINSIAVAKTGDEKIVVAYTNERCVLVYNPKKESVDSIIEDILMDGKTLSKTTSFFKNIKAATSHISFITAKGKMDVHFISGQANLKGEFTLSKHLEFPLESHAPKFPESSSISFFLNATTSKTYEAIQVEDLEIKPDSIFKHYKGNLSMELTGKTTQIDTVITYEYNDDFEKVETKAVSEKQVPEITMHVSANAKKMLHYLNNESIVENDLLNRKFFPLYQVKMDATAFGLRASTNLNKATSIPVISNNAIFELAIDFEKLLEQNQFPILKPYFEKLLNFKISGTKGENKINVEGQLNLKNSEILGISQFF